MIVISNSEEKMDVSGKIIGQSISTDRRKEVCRVCLSFDQGTRCIFGRDHSDAMGTANLSEKLRLYGGVEVGEGDGLPATICTVCVSKLNDAHELRRQCQSTDAKLRELIRLGCNATACTRTTDKACQTDYFFIPDPSKPETGSPRTDEASDLRRRTFYETAQEQRLAGTEFVNHCTSQNGRVGRRKPAGYEKVTGGREVYRTRMTTMFKRVTSMESLKNHKERQRQYIKKNAAVQRESAEKEFSGNMKNACHRIDGKSGSRLSYVCPKCNRCYFSKRSFDKHVSSHDQRQFTCEKCNKQFLQLDKLLRHAKLHKSKEKSKPVSCKICNKNFRKTDTMVRHLNAHKRVNPKEVLAILKDIREKRKLDSCLEDVEREGEDEGEGEEERQAVSDVNNKLDWNSRAPTAVQKETPNAIDTRNDSLSDSNTNADNTQPESDDSSLYQCSNCNKRYTTEKSLQRHALIHEEKKFVCNVCNMKFFREDRLKSHKNRYGHDQDRGAEVELQKPSDDKSAIKLINTWIREELDSNNEEKGFPCNICDKSYDTRKSLLTHQVKMHEKQREESCTSCNDACDCTGGKNKDREKMIEKSKPYRCDECDKCFEKEVKLQRHARIHERAKEQQDADFKRFLCHICSKTFRQNTGLMFHMRTHTGYKPHVCKYCGRGFTSNSNCINHERTHTGDRPFVCHFCSAAFAKSCTLKAHITTHTGEANYHCKTCGKSFRRLKYLKEHRFTHTGEKPYACKICGTAYSHSGSLFVHEKKCKAQYTGYQQTGGQQGCGQSQTAPPAVGPPIITGLAQPNSLVTIGTTLPAQNGGKNYIDSIQRINSQCMTASAVTTGVPASIPASSDLHVHPNSDVSDVSPPARNFALIGQIFHS